ncbi:MAG: DEAD/DEAH box helicase, partial [Verrucomicrobiota bacterium]
MLDGHDLLGCAQTGTGKTAAFALPILNYIFKHSKRLAPKTVRALILVPTRELAVQVMESVKTYGAHMRVSKALVYGGVGYGPQIRALSRGADVLVATPGRLMDLLKEDKVNLSQLEIFTLDEADRMLDMGFIHDIRKIVAEIPEDRQTLFFSATMAPEVRNLAGTLLTDSKEITITPKRVTAEKIEQHICFLDQDDKQEFL